MDDRYYTEEVSYLLELSKEFTHHHGDKAKMLHLDDVRSREPNVERLFETFAFLASRIRKRLDDDFSPIAEGLLSLIWPRYVNFVPAFSLIEFLPSAGIVSEAATIPKGAMIDSEPLSNSIQCRFRTTSDLTILPLKLSKVSVVSDGSASIMNLTFEIFGKSDRSSFKDRQLRIHIVDDPIPSFQLYDLLLGMNKSRRNVTSISLTAFNAENHSIGTWEFTHDAMTPLGLTQEDGLLPTQQSALWRFELLRDFFLFPSKFHAFKLDVLRCLADHSEVEIFNIAFHIESPWPPGLRLSKNQFRLNVVPIVNLFSHDAVPIRLNQNTRRYKVNGDVQYPECFQVYSIDRVESVEGGKMNRNLYEPLYAKDSHAPSDSQGSRTYVTDRNMDSEGGVETVVRFFNSSIDNEFSEDEIVSLSLTCANGHLTDKLAANQIHFSVSDIKEGFEARNIIPPSHFFVPDIGKISLWRWMSHAALNTLSIQSSEQLKSLLLLHDFSNAEINRHKVEGVKAVHTKPIRVLSKCALVPGIGIEITLSEENFVHPGEIQLFGRVLSVFFSLYASVNSCVQLTVTMEPSKKQIVFEPTMGDKFYL